MQSSKKRKKNKAKEQILLNIIGETVRKYRLNSGKGILLHSYEFDIPSSSLILVEKGQRDPQVTTIWKIANSLNMTFGEFIGIIEKQLPKDFSLIDD